MVNGLGLALQLDGIEFQKLGLEVGSGGLIGGVTGYAAKKIAKIIAVIVGIQLAVLKFLEARGVLSVNWNAVAETAQNATTAANAQSPPSIVMSMLSVLPFGAGFTGGFLLGFKKG